MQASEVRKFLANVQLWRGLPEDQLDALAKIAIAQTYPKGKVIFEDGDEGRGFFVVKSGRVKFTSSLLKGKNRFYTCLELESILLKYRHLMGNVSPPQQRLLRRVSYYSSPEQSF